MQITKLLRIVTVGVFFAGGVFAQMSTSTVESWAHYGVADGIVTIDLPSKPKEVHSFDKRELSYFSSLNGAYFAVIADAPEKNIPFQTALSFVREHQLVPTYQETGLVRTERYLFEDGDGFFHTVIAFFNNARSVIIHGISRVKYDPIVVRVFNSIAISNVQVGNLPGQPPGDQPAEPPLPPKPNPPMNASQVVGSGSGNGSGNSASGNGSATVPSPAPAGVVTPLKIERKPSAAYTDLARIYNIEGTVRVKVTLLASGQVGAIIPATFLPFGMTQSAITAAKSIEFTPRTVNGVPISSIVTFEYVFSIY